MFIYNYFTSSPAPQSTPSPEVKKGPALSERISAVYHWNVAVLGEDIAKPSTGFFTRVYKVLTFIIWGSNTTAAKVNNVVTSNNNNLGGGAKIDEVEQALLAEVGGSQIIQKPMRPFNPNNDHDHQNLLAAQGTPAERLTFEIAASLTASMARFPNNGHELAAFGSLLSASTNPPMGIKQSFYFFRNLIDAMKSYGKVADIQDPAQVKILNEMAKFIHKGFNPEIGGVGSFKEYSVWTKEWNELGKGIQIDNRQNLQKFNDMLSYLENNAARHFNGERHVAGVEVAIIQTIGTLGQVLQDLLCVPEKPENKIALEKLFNILNDKGMIYSGYMKEKAIDRKAIVEIQTKFRNSPLLAEVQTEVLQKEIADGVEARKGDFIALFKKEFQKYSADDAALQTAAEQIFDGLKSEINAIHPALAKTGARGRANGADQNIALALRAAGEKDPESIIVPPKRGQEPLFDQKIKATLGHMPGFNWYKTAEDPKGGHILKHDSVPENLIRVTGLDTNLRKIVSEKFLESIVDKLNGGIIDQLKKDKLSDEFKGNFAKIIGEIPLTFNAVTKAKITFAEFAKKDSMVAILQRNNLGTLCSISGTSVDITLGLICKFGQAKIKGILDSLVEHLKDKKKPLSNEFKGMFTSITFFMQAGRYHTAGEVLGGLLVAARGLSCTDAQNNNIDETYASFNQLMEEFSQSPESFFAIGEEEKSKIEAASVEFTNRRQQLSGLRNMHSMDENQLAGMLQRNGLPGDEDVK